MQSWWMLLLFALAGAAGGVIQTMCGFGAGVVLTLVYSNESLFNTDVGPAVSIAVSFVLTVYLALKLRKNLEWKKIILPLVPFLIISLLIQPGANLKLLGILFGVFQILLGIYFLWIAPSVKPNRNPVIGVICGGLSGVTGTLFGVAGPFLSVYMVAVSADMLSFTANMQFIFVISNLVILLGKIRQGLYTVSCLPSTVAGAAGILIGGMIGVRLVKKMDTAKLKKIVYYFLLPSGIATILQRIL